MSLSKCLWLSFCLVSLVAIAPAGHAYASSSGGPLLSVSVTSTDVHPGDYVSLAVSSVASWNGSKTNYSQGPIEIDAVSSAGGNYSPLSGLHPLVNGTFGMGWVVGLEPITYVSIQVTDLQTHQVSAFVIYVNPSWAQVNAWVNRTLTEANNATQAHDDSENARQWGFVYLIAGLCIALSFLVCLALDNGIKHKLAPPQESVWDRMKTWVKISRDPIPDVIDMAFTDREHVYGDVPLKAQLDILDRREEYLGWLVARNKAAIREIQQLPATREEVKARWVKNRREIGLDPEWEA